MFRPVPMDCIEILLLQRDLDSAAKRLAEEGVLHLRTMEIGKKGTPKDDTQGIKQRLDALHTLEARLRAVMDSLDIFPRGKGRTVPLRSENWGRLIGELEDRLQLLSSRIDEIRSRQTRLNDLLSLVGALRDLEVDYAQLVDRQKVVLRFGRLARLDLKALQADITPLQTFTLKEENTQVLAILLTTNARGATLQQALERIHFVPVSLPRTSGSLPGLERRLRDLLGNLDLHVRNLLSRKYALQERHRVRLQSWLRSLRAEILLLEARRRFGYTERSAVLGGWAPSSRFDDVRQAIEEVCGDQYAVFRRPADQDDTPVEVLNPRLFRPFQKMLAVYGTPDYRELEPTPLLAVGFVLLFGMMFGDLGHGLVFLAVGWTLRRKTIRWRDEGLIVMEVGACAAVFGLLFGSVFGYEELFPPLWFSPMHHIPLLMIVSLSVGISLIVTGLGLQIYNGWRRGQKAAVLTDRNGVAGLLFYVGAIITGLLIWKALLPTSAALWLALPLAGVFLHSFVADEEERPMGMRVAEGAIEVMETVLGYLANTFSFLRVAAFGLAHVGLAKAVFALADYAGGLPGGELWVIMVHITGNLIILVLEGLVVSIQAVRLEFYEFFSKFFRGEGVAYRPLALDSVFERGG